MEIGIIALIVFVSLFAIWLIFYFIPVGLWFSAVASVSSLAFLVLLLHAMNASNTRHKGMRV